MRLIVTYRIGADDLSMDRMNVKLGSNPFSAAHAKVIELAARPGTRV